MGSLEGQYFLKRGLFLPVEPPFLVGFDLARECLARLGGTPSGMVPAKAREGAATVGLLESTQCLLSQLIRDIDWASTGHSLELRTTLVDAFLLVSLGPCISSFTNDIDKAMLARSPLKSLLAACRN